MWFLKGPNGELIYLKRNSTIVVGRIQGDIVLREDKSVSRNHASITVQSKDEEKRTVCFVKDLDAKYGSSVLKGGEKIKVSKEGIKIEHNDTIKFGLQNNDFTAYYIPTVVLVSSMSDTDTLESIINDLDGYIVREWTNGITHLTTSKAKLGVKIAMALANCIPIIGIDYWKSVQLAVKNNQDWPKTTEYILPITEDVIDNSKVSLAPNFDRKTLFNDLTFLFFSYSQFNIYKKIIINAGGKSLMFNTSSHTDLKQFCSDEFIVVYYMIGANQTEESILESQRSKTAYEKIDDLLRKSKRRMISDSEIMLALLHCSLQQNCNAKHNFKELLVAQKLSAPKEKKKNRIFALDTEDARSKSSSENNENIVAETISQDFPDTEWSVLDKSRKARAPSPGLSSISSIRNDSIEPTDDVENNFANLTMNQKRPEKRSSDSVDSLPAKKAKLSLFPVISKKNTQNSLNSQNLLNSQNVLNSQDTSFSQHSNKFENARNSQLTNRDNDSVSFVDGNQKSQSQSHFSQPSSSKEKQSKSKQKKNIFDSWLEGPKEDEEVIAVTQTPEKRARISNQSTLEEKDKVTQRIRVRSDDSLLEDSAPEKNKNPAPERNKNPTSEKSYASINERDSEKVTRETDEDQMVVCDEPRTKKRRINAEDNSSSVKINFVVDRSDKRKRESGGDDSDSNNFVFRKKQAANYSAFQVTKDLNNDDDDNTFIRISGLIRQDIRDSTLNDSCGQKVFHKNTIAIPRRRISLDMMVPWVEAE